MRALGSFNKMAGYALSMLLLAGASLLAVPAMIRASGDAGWGSVALGQSIGAVAAVAVAYGWSMSGPVRVARGSSTSRLAEYRASLKVRLTLVAPSAALASAVAGLVAPARPDLAVAGALTMTLMGLSANWFFVGLSRPYVFLLVETVPRVGGTLIGIVAMSRGNDAIIGLASQAAGFATASLISGLWIARHLLAHGAQQSPSASLMSLLSSRGDGLFASLGSAGYMAAPLMIVSALAPASQPLYGLADKLQRQIAIGLGPVVTVFQGWVPRARDPLKRSQMALAAAAVSAPVLVAGVAFAGRPLMGWLGAGQLEPSNAMILLMALFVGVHFLDSVVGKAILATFHRLRDVGRATLCGAAVGLPLVVVGTLWLGPEGALAAVVVGLVVRLAWGLAVAGKILRRREGPDNMEDGEK